MMTAWSYINLSMVCPRRDGLYMLQMLKLVRTTPYNCRRYRKSFPAKPEGSRHFGTILVGRGEKQPRTDGAQESREAFIADTVGCASYGGPRGRAGRCDVAKRGIRRPSGCIGRRPLQATKYPRFGAIATQIEYFAVCTTADLQLL